MATAEVQAEARRIYFERCDSVAKLAETFSEDEVLDLLERAIMAATERAALIAETHMLGNKHVAAAIRQGSHSSNVIPHEGVVR
jgi:urease accessory protein UreE